MRTFSKTKEKDTQQHIHSWITRENFNTISDKTSLKADEILEIVPKDFWKIPECKLAKLLREWSSKSQRKATEQLLSIWAIFKYLKEEELVAALEEIALSKDQFEIQTMVDPIFEELGKRKSNLLCNFVEGFDNWDFSDFVYVFSKYLDHVHPDVITNRTIKTFSSIQSKLWYNHDSAYLINQKVLSMHFEEYIWHLTYEFYEYIYKELPSFWQNLDLVARTLFEDKIKKGKKPLSEVFKEESKEEFLYQVDSRAVVYMEKNLGEREWLEESILFPFLDEINDTQVDIEILILLSSSREPIFNLIAGNLLIRISEKLLSKEEKTSIINFLEDSSTEKRISIDPSELSGIIEKIKEEPE